MSFDFFVVFMYLQQSHVEQVETYKRQTKSLRAELDQLRADNPYYVSGSADVDNKVDDEDASRLQQRGGDWTTVDDQAKVSLLQIIGTLPRDRPCYVHCFTTNFTYDYYYYYYKICTAHKFKHA